MATIRSIAELAGISAGAVSRILNDDETLSVSPAVRERVKEIAKKEGYHKKKNLRKKSLTYGIIHWYSSKQELEDPYYLSIRLGAEEYCKKHNIHLIRIFKGDNDDLSVLTQTDGLICIGKFSEEEISSFSEYCSNLILVDMYSKQITHPCVVLDFRGSMYQILDYLYELGHRKIGFLGGKEYLRVDTLYEDMRKTTFELYCAKKNILYEPFLYEDAYTIDAGYQMMNELLKKNQLPTAVFGASDAIALGAMHALYEHGIQVPKDMSVAGFNDIDAARFSYPPLTTIKAPAKTLGEYAAYMLDTNPVIENASEYLHIPMRIELPCQLVIRGSCCPPA